MILITGASGFIASALAYHLNRKNLNNLILCDSFGIKEKWKNILGLKFSRIVDRNCLFEFLKSDPEAKRITTVIHLGACADTTEKNVDYLMEMNFRYSQKLCEWSIDNKSKFIYASSASVYGDGSCGFSDSDELTPRLRPLNAYGFSKWLFDMYVVNCKLTSIVTGLRFFNVFGPNEYHKGNMASVIFRSFPQVMKEGKIRLFESHRSDYEHGCQERDFIYIDEVLETFDFLIDHPRVSGIFNCGSGKAHTFNQLAESMFCAVNKPLNIEYFPMPEEIREKYQYHTCADMSSLIKAGYKVQPDRFDYFVKKYVTNYLCAGFKHYSQI